MDEKKATELVPVKETELELPPILVGRATPAVAAQVQDFYESVAQIFERWVTRRASTHSSTEPTIQRSAKSIILGTPGSDSA